MKIEKIQVRGIKKKKQAVRKQIECKKFNSTIKYN